MFLFSEYYNKMSETNSATFFEYIKSLYDDILMIPDVTCFYHNKKEPEIHITDYERAKFTLQKRFPKLENADENVIKEEVEKWHKGMSSLLGIVNVNPKIENIHGFKTFIYDNVKLKNGYTVTYRSTIITDYIPYVIDYFYFVGKKKYIEREFHIYGEYKPDVILCTEPYEGFVYFYQIVKRSGNIIYYRKLKNDYVTGEGFYGYVRANRDVFDDKSENVYSTSLPSPDIDGVIAVVWDGKPRYYNNMF